jgi:hypothetical protein
VKRSKHRGINKQAHYVSKHTEMVRKLPALQNEKSIAEWSESYQGSIIARSASTLQIGCPNPKRVAIVKITRMPTSIE